jgi:Ca2+-binding RTX toxin-like protein
VSRLKLALSTLLAVLALPGLSYADHISLTAELDLRLAERTGSDSWVVEVSWRADCRGVGAGGAGYQGNLYLVDIDRGERIYLGGVSSGTGQARQIVRALDQPRRMRAELRLSCFDNDSLHGSGTSVFVSSGVLFVPPKDLPPDVDPEFRGGHRGPSDPTEPAADGGCADVIQGTTGPDRLTGTGAPEIIFGFSGADVIRGRAGHDCLIGSRGNDRLLGQAGFDRLTGGSGRDRLVGGPGVNAYDAGPGRDFVDARNGRRELVRCGSGRDTARVDRRDRVRSCERVRRPR